MSDRVMSKADYQESERKVAASTGVDPEQRQGRVIVVAQWRGLEHRSERLIAAEQAQLHVMDQQVFGAATEVRKRLIAQRHGADAVTGEPNLRSTAEAMEQITRYCLRTGARFILFPPSDDSLTPSEDNQWISMLTRSEPGGVPPRAGGSSPGLAIENLLRQTEGREPTSG